MPTVSEIQSSIEKGREQSQQAEKQISTYEKSLPDMNSQRLLRSVNYKQPLQAQQQRIKIAQANQEVGKARQQLAQYNQGLDEYNQQFEAYKQKVADQSLYEEGFKLAVEDSSQGQSRYLRDDNPIFVKGYLAAREAISKEQSRQGGVQSALNYGNKSEKSKAASQVYNSLMKAPTNYTQSHGITTQQDLNAPYVTSSGAVINFQTGQVQMPTNNGLKDITPSSVSNELKFNLPTFTNQGTSGLAGQGEFNKDFAQPNEVKRSWLTGMATGIPMVSASESSNISLNNMSNSLSNGPAISNRLPTGTIIGNNIQYSNDNRPNGDSSSSGFASLLRDIKEGLKVPTGQTVVQVGEKEFSASAEPALRNTINLETGATPTRFVEIKNDLSPGLLSSIGSKIGNVATKGFDVLDFKRDNAIFGQPLWAKDGELVYPTKTITLPSGERALVPGYRAVSGYDQQGNPVRQGEALPYGYSDKTSKETMVWNLDEGTSTLQSGKSSPLSNVGIVKGQTIEPVAELKYQLKNQINPERIYGKSGGILRDFLAGSVDIIPETARGIVITPLALYGLGKVGALYPKATNLLFGATGLSSGKSYLNAQDIDKKEASALGLGLSLIPFIPVASRTYKYASELPTTFGSISKLIPSKLEAGYSTARSGIDYILGGKNIGLQSYKTKSGKDKLLNIRSGPTKQTEEGLLKTVRNFKDPNKFTAQGQTSYETPVTAKYKVGLYTFDGFKNMQVTLTDKSLQDITLGKNIFKTKSLGDKNFELNGKGLVKAKQKYNEFEQKGLFEIAPRKVTREYDRAFNLKGKSTYQEGENVLISNLLKNSKVKRVSETIPSKEVNINEITLETKSGRKGIGTTFDKKSDIFYGESKALFKGLRTTVIKGATNKEVPIVKIQQLVPGRMSKSKGGGYSFTTDTKLIDTKAIIDGEQRDIMRTITLGRARGVSSAGRKEVVTKFKTKDIFDSPPPSGGGKSSGGSISEDLSGMGGNSLGDSSPENRFADLFTKPRANQLDQQIIYSLGPMDINIKSPIDIKSSSLGTSYLGYGLLKSPVTITSTQTETKSQSRQLEKSLIINKSQLSNVSSSLSQAITPVTTQTTIQDIGQILTPVTTQAQTQSLSQVARPIQVITPIIIPNQIPRPPRPVPPKSPRINASIFSTPNLKSKSRNKIKPSKSFDVYTKVKGKEVLLASRVTERAAKDIGTSAVLFGNKKAGALSASIILKEGKGPARNIATRGEFGRYREAFRPSKSSPNNPFVLVQKERANILTGRLGTSQERSAIKMSRYKKGGMFSLK